MMKRVATLCVISVVLASMVILPATPVLNAPAAAQTPPNFNLGEPTSAQVEIPAPTLRTKSDMLADQATHALPHAPGAGRAVPFRPGADPAKYNSAKAAGAAARPAPRVKSAPRVAQNLSQNLAVGPLNCNGENQVGAASSGVQFWPPDTDAAVGITQFVQTTNSHVTVWFKGAVPGTSCPGAPLLDIDLNSFMGFFVTFLFDARVVHDDTFHRWVVSADSFPVTATGPQLQFVAVSISEDATGPYFVFAFDTTLLSVPPCPTCFWDFPQLGMDENAIILTANIFNPFFVGSRWLFLDKQRLYYGLGLIGCFFLGGALGLPSWAPPKVMDLDPVTWMAEAPPFSFALFMVGMSSTNLICPIVEARRAIVVPPYTVPPNAAQPGTTEMLDTLDARFQNRSVQVGGSLWNVHTVGPGLPTPRYYRISVNLFVTGVFLEEVADFFASGTSFDFNPSIVANFAKTIAVTWSSTDPGPGINAQVRVGAKANGGTFNQALVFGSSVPLVGNPSGVPGIQRWGDYSYIAISPTNSSAAFGINEDVNPLDATGGTWGSRQFKISIP